MKLFVGLLLLIASPAFGQTPPPAGPAAERLAADTPKTTVLGNTFIAPAEWTVSVRGPATILERSGRATPRSRSWT